MISRDRMSEAMQMIIERQSRRIAELSILLEDAEFMLRKISNHPKNAEHMVDSANRFCADARELLAKGTE